MLPALSGFRFLSFTHTIPAIVVMLIALVSYLAGVGRANKKNPRHPWPVARTVGFLAAIVVTAIAVLSFVGVYDGELFWDHMVQHLLLIMVAGPLFAIGAPIRLAYLACDQKHRATLATLLRTRISEYLGHPMPVFAMYAVVIPLTHLTSFYNDTIAYPELRHVEQIIYVVVGYLFWRQIFSADPNRYRMEPGVKFLYLFLAIPIDTFTGVSLNSTTRELFPAYLSEGRTWGPTVVEDLHIGGVMMWVGGDTLMLWPMIPVALAWMHLEERRALRSDLLLYGSTFANLPPESSEIPLHALEHTNGHKNPPTSLANQNE